MTKNRISELFAVAMHCCWGPHVLGKPQPKAAWRLCSSLYYPVSGRMLMRPFGRISFHSCYDSIAEDLELHDTA
jgi:hypothetical protein